MVPGTSRVRLDPLRHIYELRAYAEPVDTRAPLSEMRLPYLVVGIVTIVAGIAVVEMVRGEISRAAMQDFEAAVRALGVTRIDWERHRPDGTIKTVARAI